MRRWHLLARVESGIEKGVDKCRLAETGLSDHHGSEGETFSDTLAVNLVGQVGETDVAHQLLSSSSDSARDAASVCCASVNLVTVHDDRNVCGRGLL